MTTLKETIQADLTVAMRARDELTTSTLRMALAAVMNAEVAGASAIVLTDTQIVAVLQSEAKKRAEAAEIYAGAGRAELAAKEKAEMAVIGRYLPAAMSDDDLARIIAEEVAVAAAAGHTGSKSMGIVVKAVRNRTAGSADGAKVAALVKDALV